MGRGIAVSICTGRMYSGTRHVARELGLSGPVACVDGSHIVDAANDRELATSTIHDDAASGLLSLLDVHRPVTFVFADDRVFHDEAGKEYLGYVRTWSDRVVELGDVLDPVHWGATPGMCALVTLGTEKQIRGAESAIHASHAERVQTTSFLVRRDGFQGLWGMVIRAAGVSKGTALEWMAERRGIAADEVVAVGDWLNDVPMMRAAGRSFVMAQAPDEVKAAATDLLEADTWSGGGIAEAARRCGLL